MNKRLELIMSRICTSRGLIDVGTDHGYLPIALAQNGYKGAIIASDINIEPLNKARENAKASGFDKRIDFRLGNGLEACESHEVDTIVIAGMGGDSICGILDRAEWCMSPDYELILQPMTKAEILRYWLVNNGFVIKYEDRVLENGTVYQIITTRFEDRNTRLSDAELFTGAVSLRRDGLFSFELDTLIHRFNKAAEGMREAERKSALRRLYLDIISELEEMRMHHAQN